MVSAPISDNDNKIQPALEMTKKGGEDEGGALTPLPVSSTTNLRRFFFQPNSLSQSTLHGHQLPDMPEFQPIIPMTTASTIVHILQ